MIISSILFNFCKCPSNRLTSSNLMSAVVFPVPCPAFYSKQWCYKYGQYCYSPPSESVLQVGNLGTPMWWPRSKWSLHMWHSEKDRNKIHKVVQHKIRSIMSLLYLVRWRKMIIEMSVEVARETAQRWQERGAQRETVWEMAQDSTRGWVRWHEMVQQGR